MARQLTDEDAERILQMWKVFPGAAILPVIGYPSNSGGVVTITHQMPGPMMKINGLTSKSPLANNALYSVEVSGGKYINLYEIMVADIPGKNGHQSTGSQYVQAIGDEGLQVAGVHFHWWGSTVVPQDKGVTAVHHQMTGDMDPYEFSARTIRALQSTMEH